MMIKGKNTEGFTVIETFVSIILLSVVLIGAYGVLITGNNIFITDIALLDMQQQTRNAIDRIVREARPASSQTITINYNSTTNDYLQIISPTTPAAGSPARGVQYYLSGTNLIREYPTGTIKKVASNISLLKFTLTGSLLQIQVRAGKTIYTKVISFPLIEQVRLRNE